MPKEMVGSDEVSAMDRDRGLEHMKQAREFVLESIDRVALSMEGQDVTILWGWVAGVLKAIITATPPELFPSGDSDGPPESFLQKFRTGPLAIAGKLAAAVASSVAVAACNSPIAPQQDNDDQPQFTTATLALTAADMDHLSAPQPIPWSQFGDDVPEVSTIMVNGQPKKVFTFDLTRVAIVKNF